MILCWAEDMTEYSKVKLLQRIVVFLLITVILIFSSGSCGNNSPAETTEQTSAAETAETTAVKVSSETEAAPIIARDMASIINISAEDLAVKTPVSDENNYVERCDKPNITVYKFIKDNMVFFGGTTANDSVVKVTGGTEDMVFHPEMGADGRDGNFWGAVYINSGVSTLDITASAEGKDDSDPITMIVRPQSGITLFQDHGVCGVIVGDRFQGHFEGAIADYVGSNLLNDKQSSAVEKAMGKRVEAASKNGAKIVYLLIPNPMNLYPETVPAEYVRYSGNDSLTKQFTEIAEKCGADVIDLTDCFIEHRYDEFKLFHKTDSHWTQYGSYWGYKAFCEYLMKEFPDAAPRDVSQFRFYSQNMVSGDMSTHLEIDNNTLYENATLCELLFESPYEPNFLFPGKVEVDPSEFRDSHTVKNRDSTRKLPNLVFYRDSFASCSECMFNDTGADIYWADMWDYSLNTDHIKQVDADYVVYLITERNIVNVMY